MSDDHLHTCPFKPGGRAAELCAASCGLNRCSGRQGPPPEPPDPLQLLAERLGAKPVLVFEAGEPRKPTGRDVYIPRQRRRRVETIKFADREEPLL